MNVLASKLELLMNNVNNYHTTFCLRLSTKIKGCIELEQERLGVNDKKCKKLHVLVGENWFRAFEIFGIRKRTWAFEIGKK